MGAAVKLDSSVKLSVGFLYTDDVGEKKPFGSCFFIFANTRHHGEVFYLVTAKHVLRQMRTAMGQMYVRLNRKGKQGVYYHPLPRDGWHEHDDDSVDAVVLQVDPRTEEGKDAELLAIDLNAVLETPDIVLKNEPGHDWPPREGEEICIVALFLQHPGRERNHPVFRFGHICLMSDERLDGEYGPSEYHLIESQVYRGHSGAPVFVHYGGLQMYLFGVLAAAYRTEEEIFSRPGRTETYYNLGISKVVPIQKVMDILNQEDLKRYREEEGAPEDNSNTS